jgi:hypothetical protein
LDVNSREVSRYLNRERGERIEKGEIIAGPAGITRRTVRAPSDGKIVAITGGSVLFEVRSDPHILRAGMPGEVVGMDGTMSVVLETTGALIQGSWGNGRQDFGVMRMIGESAKERLLTDQLDVKLRGAVLVAGICDHPAPLHQAKELAVRGIILGGMSADLVPVAKSLPYPIIVLEGFGALSINIAAYELLKTSQGREAALDARPIKLYDPHRPEVIIPLPVVNPVELPEDLIPISRGVRVRVTRSPYQGAVGVVGEILPHTVSYPSGVQAQSASVELEIFGTTTVPLANLNVLQ